MACSGANLAATYAYALADPNESQSSISTLYAEAGLFVGDIILGKIRGFAAWPGIVRPIFFCFVQACLY